MSISTKSKCDPTVASEVETIDRALRAVCHTTSMRVAALVQEHDGQSVVVRIVDSAGLDISSAELLSLDVPFTSGVITDHYFLSSSHPSASGRLLLKGPIHSFEFPYYVCAPVYAPNGAILGMLWAMDMERAPQLSGPVRDLVLCLAELIGYREAVKREPDVLRSNPDAAVQALPERVIGLLGHELRTPLSTMSTALQILVSLPIDKKGLEVVRIAQNSVRQMTETIENIVDFARARLGGGMVLHRSGSENLELILYKIVQEAQLKHPEHCVDADFDLSLPVDCDAQKVGRLASNLLTSSIKTAVAENPIHVVARTLHGALEISVTNKGAALVSSPLGTKVSQIGEEILDTNFRGGALSLFVCESIATAHGGTLNLTSNAEESSFFFRMPLDRMQ